MHSIQPVGGPWEPDRRFTWPNSLPGANRPCPISAAYLLLLLVAICKQWTIAAQVSVTAACLTARGLGRSQLETFGLQRPLQFIPAGIEAEIPARLAFRPEVSPWPISSLVSQLLVLDCNASLLARQLLSVAEVLNGVSTQGLVEALTDPDGSTAVISGETTFCQLYMLQQCNRGSNATECWPTHGCWPT